MFKKSKNQIWILSKNLFVIIIIVENIWNKIKIKVFMKDGSKIQNLKKFHKIKMIIINNIISKIKIKVY